MDIEIMKDTLTIAMFKTGFLAIGLIFMLIVLLFYKKQIDEINRKDELQGRSVWAYEKTKDVSVIVLFGELMILIATLITINCLF